MIRVGEEKQRRGMVPGPMNRTEQSPRPGRKEPQEESGAAPIRGLRRSSSFFGEKGGEELRERVDFFSPL